MKRFVAKEDVEKGLVDPTKPISEQPQYKKKIQENTQKKDTSDQRKDTADQKDRKPRRERQDRPKFNWDRKLITLETPTPEAPKKVLAKPDHEKFNANLKKLKDQKQSYFEEIKKLIDEQKFLIKSNKDNKSSGYTALSKYSGELKQKNNLKNVIDSRIKNLEEKRNDVQNQIKQLKQESKVLKFPKDLEQMTIQQLKQKVNHLQHRLSTAHLDKKQEAQINANINLTKRALLKSKPQIEINTLISKTEDKIKILTDESRNLKHELDAQYSQLKPLKKEIFDLLQKKKGEQGTIVDVRPIEQIRGEYDLKIKAIEIKKQQVIKKIDELKTKFNKDIDLWQDQQDLLKYIKYVEQQKQYKRKRKQQDERRKKQFQQKQKQKKKQFQQRQKKRQQRQKQQQQRKKKQQQRKIKLQNQRQTFINRNPHHKRIQLCQFMIKYCQNLKPQHHHKIQEKNIQKLEDVNLQKHKAWEKQAKSGCKVIVGKKQKQEQQAPKKGKKQKKIQPKQDDGSIHHNIDVVNRFHQLKVLPPSNVSQLDQTIKHLNDQIQVLNKPTEQQIAAFKVKAEAQFDRMHGFHQQKQHDHHDDKEEKHDKKQHKPHKVELKGHDFPELN